MIPPWVEYTFPKVTGYNTRMRHTNYMKTMFEDIIQDHEKTFNPDSKPRVFILL